MRGEGLPSPLPPSLLGTIGRPPAKSSEGSVGNPKPNRFSSPRRQKPRTLTDPQVHLGDFGALWELGFEVLELGFEDLRLGFRNLVLGFEGGGLGFEVLREERGVLSREAGWLGGVRAPGARFACLGGCSRTWWGNTCRWGYGIPLAHCMLLSCPHGVPSPLLSLHLPLA